jgi:hypothetical protein
MMRIAFVLCVACLAGVLDAQTNLLQANTSSVLSGGAGSTRTVAPADFDGDGDLDVFLANSGEDNMLFVNHGNGTFEELAPEVITTDGGFTFHAAWGDMDGDGDLDLATANGNSMNNGLFKNLRELGFVITPQFVKQTASPVCNDAGASYAVAWGDVDGDGDNDLLFANKLEPTFYYDNQGGGSFVSITTGPLVTDNGPSRDICLGDLDGDGDLEIVLANSNDLANFFYVNQGGTQGGVEGTFAALTGDPVVAELTKTFGASMGDFNGDGALDLFFSNRKGQLNTLYANDGSGGFTLAASQHPAQDGGDSYHGTWGDIEGDGDMDLFVTNRDGANFYYMNDGANLQRVAMSPAVSDGGDSRHAAFADLNADGFLSLVVANTLGEDNFVYDNLVAPWQSLGLAFQPVPGADEPFLSGSGTLLAATVATLFVQDAPANAVITLVVGLSRIDMPFRGGVLVPAPDVVVSGFTSDANGDFSVNFAVPTGAPVGTQIFLQSWVQEALSPTGLVSSNGLEATLN